VFSFQLNEICYQQSVDHNTNFAGATYAGQLPEEVVKI